MGEAKRRKKLNPNYGQSNILENVKREIRNAFLDSQTPKEGALLLIIYTNRERGCTEQEIKLLQEKVPELYKEKKFTLLVLPKKYAKLPVDEAIPYLVTIPTIECEDPKALSYTLARQKHLGF